MKTSLKKHFILLSVILTTSFSLNAQVPDFTSAAEKSINAVVHVKTKTEIKQRSMMGFDDDPFFQFFFGQPRMQQQQKPKPVMASGSGVIITEDGYIVTNNHVIADADEIEVVLNDKKTYTAQVVGTDPNTDIALLKIDASKLHTIPFGNSDDLKIGEWVLAIGNPFNLTSTVTAGIVSAKARNINILSSDMKIEAFIQTDAAVNPGNSGGALVNLKGELVGINTAIATQTGSYSGYSFAIPSSLVQKVVDDLKKYGEVQRAILGVSISDISDELAKEKKISVMEGAYVHSVSEGSAAQAAGIKEGDIITKINDKKVKSVAELQEQIARKAPGDNVSVTVQRNDSEKTFSVELKNKRGNLDVMTANTLDELGASFQELSNEKLQKFKISNGVLVASVSKDGKFQQAGIKKDFVIIRINNKPIKDIKDIKNALSEVSNGSNRDNALFISGIYTTGEAGYYAIDLSKK